VRSSDARRQDRADAEARRARPAQGSLFGDGRPEWAEHWRGMPEFVQEDLAPVASATIAFEDGDLYVHFEDRADKREFEVRLSAALAARNADFADGAATPARLGREWFSGVVDQDVTRGLSCGDRKRTQSIWYPEAEIGHFAGKAYVDRDNLPKSERALERDGVVDLREAK
jgi:hypothetical protein